MQFGVNTLGTRVLSHLKVPLFWNSYMLIIMRVTATGFGFVFWAIAARTMSAEQVGLGSGIMSSVSLLASIAQLGLGFGLVRHASNSANVNGLLNIVFLITGFAALLLSVLYLSLLEFLSPVLLPLRENFVFFVLFVVMVVAWTQSTILNWVFIAMRRTIYSLTRQASHMVAAVLVLLVAVLYSTTYSAILIAHLLAVLISVGLSFGVMPKVVDGYRFSLRLRDAYQELIRERVATYSIINFVAEQFNRIPDSVLPLLIVNVLGPSQGAYFFIVWMIGRAVPAWVSAVSQSLFAEGSNDPEKATEFAWKTVKLALLLCLGPVLLILVSGHLILSVYGSDYVTEGLNLLYVVTLASVPSILLSIFASIMRIRDQLRALFVLQVAGNGLTILFCYIGMVWFGLLGVGVGWLATQLLVLVGCMVWWLRSRSVS